MNDYYGNNDWRDYLAHYGVKGMKWRKRKRLSDMPAAQDSFYGINANSSPEERADAFRRSYRLGQAYGYGRVRAKRAAKAYKKTKRAYTRDKRIKAIKNKILSIGGKAKRTVKRSNDDTVKEQYVREKKIYERFAGDTGVGGAIRRTKMITGSALRKTLKKRKRKS